MKKKIIFIIILIVSSITYSQKRNQTDSDEGLIKEEKTHSKENNSTGKKKSGDVKKKPSITEYKIINIHNDTTYVDTSLTIQKDYRFNYLRRDDFELLPINNVGQSHTSLAKVEERDHLLPLFGARSRHFNYLEAKDIRYYNVPTPLTELYFKTTFEQGQQVDAFLTVNTSPNLNFSIAYKGIRSLGKYKHALTSSSNFRATANFHTKNKRYLVKTHFVEQGLKNEENGGLSENGIKQYLSLEEFKEDKKRYSDRGAIEVNYEDAESTLSGKRFYLNHKFAVIKKDSTNISLSIGHIMDMTDKYYQFDQAKKAPNNLLGESYIKTGLRDNVALEDFYNQLHIEFNNKWIGTFKVKGAISNYNYGYNTILILNQLDKKGNPIKITNRIKGEINSIGGEYYNNYKNVELFADGMTIISGDFTGNYLNLGTGYSLDKKYEAKLQISANSVAPNYNFLLYQSDYKNYNWQNTFENIKTQKLQLNISAKKIASIEASYSKIDNYSYFAKDKDLKISPNQYKDKINLLKVKLTQETQFWKLGIDNTFLYQNVTGEENVYKVPKIVTRNSLYFQDHYFKKNALFLQTGVTFKYFSKYEIDAYDPVLSEFYIQNDQKSGGFPQFDIFFNAKVRQTRIYFKYENILESLKQNNEFSAPGYANRDAVLRFGIVWNFFL